MAHAKPRANGRWTAVYLDLSGREKSAGTFDDQERALAVAQAQESFIRGGSDGSSPLEKATVTLNDYFPRWLRAHKVEPSTKRGYADVYRSYIEDPLGEIRVAELSREQIRAYIAVLEEKRLSPSTQKKVRSVLSAMMQTAWDDGYRTDNPARGVRTQRGSSKPIPVLSTEMFGRVYTNLPTDGARTLASTVVATGCRPSEAMPLLVDDWDSKARVMSFTKAVQDAGAEFNPGGPRQRFYVAPYTKTHDHRHISVDEATAVEIDDWIEANGLKSGDLLFPAHMVKPTPARARKPRVELTPEVLAELGEFEGANGITYQHGEVKAYAAGKCRCWACRQAMADYKNERNATAREASRKRGRKKPRSERYYDESPYVGDDSWRLIWKKACKTAGLTFQPTAYQLRHAHASWLIDAGQTPKKVMERLGQKDLSTTSRYVHVVDVDKTSAEMMGRIRKW